MKHFIRLLALSAFFLGLRLVAFAQENRTAQEAQESQEAPENPDGPDGPKKPEIDHSYKPIVLKMSEDGSKYARFLFWHQHWIQTNNLAVEGGGLQLTHSVRRSRAMAYAQVSPRFLILTHIGLNNLTPNNITTLGNDGDSPQFFLHEAWTEFKVSNNDALYLGGGLHYWRGLTRMTSHGTTTFMALDIPRPNIHWHSSLITDQFNRHLGAYAKGQIKGFDYRLSTGNAGQNGQQNDYGSKDSGLAYDGFEHPGRDGKPTGNTIVEGYFRYNFWDEEATLIPNAVGTYLGSKKVLALGGGFFAHPDGMYRASNGAHSDVFHYAVDAYLDTPLSQEDCLNVYVSFINFDYGEGFVSRWAGTGTAFYGQVGYKLPRSRFMPYLAVQSASYEGLGGDIQALDLGLNYFISGHNAKVTLEFHSVFNDRREGGTDPLTGEAQDVEVVRLQAQVFL